MSYQTRFGSLQDFEKGSIEIINDDPKHYVFSNLFEVAKGAGPYEKVVVGKNLEYVIEVMRAKGTSPWFAAAHDEFAVVMDGEIEIEFFKLDDPGSVVAEDHEGSVRLESEPKGAPMGSIRMRRGHQALLPASAAYRFVGIAEGVVLLQTMQGEHSIEKWAEICLH
jgi:hypothetical protein